MTYEIGALFEDCDILTKIRTKAEYEHNTKLFKERRMEYLNPLFEAYEGELEEKAEEFAKEAFETFSKRGKVKGKVMLNLNYFMIYYIFPTILFEKPTTGKAMCQVLRDKWNATFPDCNIDFTDYESLSEGFQTKIFGVPIRKN